MPIDNKSNYPNNAYYFPKVSGVIDAMVSALKTNKKQMDDSPDEPLDIPIHQIKKIFNKNEVNEKDKEVGLLIC